MNFAYGQVGIGTMEPDPSAALDVKSPDSENPRGVLVPRMSRYERDMIKSPSNGLLIFNIDENCFDYYDESTGLWNNLCGGIPNSIGTIDCSFTSINGVYIQGMLANGGNFLSVTVSVTRPGTYNITAAPSPANGYYFTSSGSFPAAGKYIVNLQANGIPTNANSEGDPVFLTFNGMDADCMGIKVPVLPASPDYTITAVSVNPSTPYIPNQQIDGTHCYLTVTLNVKIPGRWSLVTGEVNGYYFSGQGDISAASGYNPNGNFPQTIIVQVPAYGMPVNSASTDNFTLSTTNLASPSMYPFKVQTASVSFAPICSGVNNTANVTVNGSFATGQTLTGSETIVVPINVIVPGTTVLTAAGAGMTFSSGEVALGTSTSEIILTPANTSAPTVGGNQNMILNGEGLTGYCNLIPVTVGTPQAQIDLNSVTYSYLDQNNAPSASNGRYIVSHSINPDDGNPDKPIHIKVSFTVTKAGNYDFTTEALNGITYSASGIFTNIGSNSVILTPSGTPDKTGMQNYIISGSGISVEVPVYYAYRQFNIVSFTSAGGYGFYGNPVANSITKGTGTFGPGGLVPCEDSPKFVNIATDLGVGSAANVTALVNAINNNKADIVYIGPSVFQQSTANQTILNVIKDFVFNKHGILIFAHEYAAPTANSYATQLVNSLFDTAINPSVNTSVGIAYHGTFTSNPSEIINGPFGNLAGLMQTATGVNSGYIPSSVTVPNSIVVSRISKGNTAAYVDGIMSLQSNKLGVYMSFDNTFFYTPTMPVASINSTTGVPVLPRSAGTTTADTNSALFANLFAWALKYGAYNIHTSYQVSSTANNLDYPSDFSPRTPQK